MTRAEEITDQAWRECPNTKKDSGMCMVCVIKLAKRIVALERQLEIARERRRE